MNASRAEYWMCDFPNEYQWLKQYTGTNDFFCRLQEQLCSWGYLTDKQTACVTREIQRGQFRPSEQYQVGGGIEIKAWLARAVAEEFKTIPVNLEEPVAFRNLEITEYIRETPKAVQISFRYSSKICERCHVCGKELDTEISRACGIGPVCAKKLGFPRATLEDAGKIIERMEAVCRDIGEIGPRWIPKSQIVRTWKAE